MCRTGFQLWLRPCRAPPLSTYISFTLREEFWPIPWHDRCRSISRRTSSACWATRGPTTAGSSSVRPAVPRCALLRCLQTCPCPGLLVMHLAAPHTPRPTKTSPRWARGVRCRSLQVWQHLAHRPQLHPRLERRGAGLKEVGDVPTGDHAARWAASHCAAYALLHFACSVMSAGHWPPGALCSSQLAENCQARRLQAQLRATSAAARARACIYALIFSCLQACSPARTAPTCRARCRCWSGF